MEFAKAGAGTSEIDPPCKRDSSEKPVSELVQVPIPNLLVILYVYRCGYFDFAGAGNLFVNYPIDRASQKLLKLSVFAFALQPSPCFSDDMMEEPGNMSGPVG